MKDMELFRLEDRVLFEAAAAAEIIEASAAAQNDPNADVSETERLAKEAQEALKNAPPETPAAPVGNDRAGDVAAVSDIDAQINALIEGEIVPVDDAGGDTASDGAKELFVINGSVPDKDVLIDNLAPGSEVLILQENSGLDEVNNYLDQQSGEYSAIHFITHGSDNQLVINARVLTADDIDADSWQALGEHVSEDGDLLFYGCDLASGNDGKLLIDRIAEASGCDVSASVDDTGVSGNWELEYSYGTVESTVLSVADYQYDLASYTVDNLDDSGDGSFRYGLENGFDEIVFRSDLSGTISLAGGIYLEPAGNITITGNGNVIIDGGSGNFVMLDIYDLSGTAEITISNLTFANGGDTALRVDGAAVLTITDSTFTGNGDTLAYGGAVSVYGQGSLEVHISGSTFTGNTAGSGGAVYATDANVEIEKSVFKNNTADFGSVLNVEYGSLDISGSSFAGNQDSNAAVWASEVTAFTIDNSTFADNSGGAVNLHNTSSINAVISNSTFAGNAGGALENTGTAVTVSNTIMAGNGTSDILQNAAGSMTLDHALVSAVNGEYTATNSTVGSAVTLDSMFGKTADYYDNRRNVIELDAFSIAAYSGKAVAGVDQLGNTRGVSIFGETFYAVGALSSAIGVKISADDAGSVYTAKPFSPTFTVEYAGKSVAGSAAWTAEKSGSAVTEIKNAGVYTVTPEGDITVGTRVLTASDPNAKIVYQNGTITISKATLTISVGSADISKKYDGNSSVENADKSYSCSGLLETDTVTSFSADWNYDSVNAASGIGVSVSNIVLDDVISENYTYNTAFSATGEITARSVIIVANSAAKVYDGTPLTDSGYSIDGDGFVGSDNFESVTVTGSQTLVGTSDNVVTAWTLLDSVVAGNYVISTANGTLTVTGAALSLTLSAGSASQKYDGSVLTEDSWSIVSGALAAGDTISTITVDGSITNVGSTANKITSVIITHGGIDVTSNYSITTQDGTLTVTPREITITSADGSWKYDGSAHTKEEVTIGGDGFVAGEGLTASNFASITNVSESGKANTFDYAFNAGTQASNYSITGVYFGTLTVTPREITITSADGSWKYDGFAHTKEEVTIGGDGFVTGEGLTASNFASITNVSESGKGNTFDYAFNAGTQTSNYTVTGVIFGTLTVTPRHITIFSTDGSWVYDGTAHTQQQLVIGGDGFAGTEGISGNNFASITNVSESGKANTFDYTFNAGTLAENYVVDQINTGTLTVTPRTVSVTLSDLADKVYNGKVDDAVISGGTISNLASGETLTIIQVGKGYYNSPDVLTADHADFVISLGSGSGNVENYLLAEDHLSANARITARPVDVDWSSPSVFVYDAQDHSGEVSASYTDIDGSVIPLPLDWNGETLLMPGSYTVSVDVSTLDPNYTIGSGGSQTYTIALPTGAHLDYDSFSQGLNANFSSVLPALNTRVMLSAPEAGVSAAAAGDYPWLLSLELSARENVLSSAGYSIRETVSVDPLIERPFLAENISRTGSASVAESGDLLDANDLFAGDRLFADDDSFVINGSLDTRMYLFTVPETSVAAADGDDPELALAPADLPQDELLAMSVGAELADAGMALAEKHESFKSSLDKLLEEMLAV